MRVRVKVISCQNRTMLGLIYSCGSAKRNLQRKAQDNGDAKAKAKFYRKRMDR